MDLAGACHKVHENVSVEIGTICRTAHLCVTEVFHKLLALQIMIAMLLVYTH